MEKEELKKTNDFHETYIDRWTYWDSAYKGGEDFIELVLRQNERESVGNFKARKDEAICLNYSAKIVDMYNFYLTEKPAIRELGKLSNERQWQMFEKDCDLYSTNFDIFMNEAQRTSSIFGAVGILVDKPPGDGTTETKLDEINTGIYPYCAIYTLPNVRDWTRTLDERTGRQNLTYLKLTNYDGKYFLWWPDHWEVWEIPEDERGTELDPVLVREGENILGEIPFLWMINVRSPSDPYLGLSDIREIARIQASIVNDFSHGNEVIKYAAFPMLLEPWESENDDTVGVRAVKGFDPENPQAKPEWLEAAVQEPISAVLDWVETKVTEIFEMAHLAGVHATEKSREARSGVSLRYEFQMMSSILSKKNDNMTEAELQIIKYWLKWQNMSDLFPNVKISRSREFSVDDLSQSIDAMLKAQPEIYSMTFQMLLQQQVAKRVLPDMTETERNEVLDEIAANLAPKTIDEFIGALKESKTRKRGGVTEIRDMEGQFRDKEPDDISED